MTKPLTLSESLYDQIADALAQDGCIILPNFLPDEMTHQLTQYVGDLPKQQFKAAGIGRNDERQLKQQVRNDTTRWLSNDSIAEQNYLAVMEECRHQLNQRLYLGLFDYEAHFAHYAQGNYYQRHIDAFQGQSNRVVTTVFYLNPNWSEEDAGELLIYSPNSDEILQRVLPKFGTMVIFLSDRFPHEVLAAKQDRYSIAGWFRTNNSNSQTIDPLS